jgi:GntR family transcriptional repressor for pyruvate dehydrogenase complex
MYTPIHSGRLYEKIVEQIETLILRGKLQPGDKLPSERELAEQFAVSRTAVREAMKTLTHKGLIEVSPGRGTYVTDGTTQAVRHSLGLMIKLGLEEGTRHLVEVREILEPEIATMAAQRRKEEHLAAMRNAVAVMDDSMNDVGTFIEADLDFHLALAEATQNPLILMLIDTMVDLLRGLRERIAQVQGGMQRAQHHHKRILAAIEAGDTEAARQAMHAHMQQVHEDSVASLDIST